MTAKEVAEWMLDQFNNEKWLYQETVEKKVEQCAKAIPQRD